MTEVVVPRAGISDKARKLVATTSKISEALNMMDIPAQRFSDAAKNYSTTSRSSSKSRKTSSVSSSTSGKKTKTVPKPPKQLVKKPSKETIDSAQNSKTPIVAPIMTSNSKTRLDREVSFSPIEPEIILFPLSNEVPIKSEPQELVAGTPPPEPESPVLQSCREVQQTNDISSLNSSQVKFSLDPLALGMPADNLRPSPIISNQDSKVKFETITPNQLLEQNSPTIMQNGLYLSPMNGQLSSFSVPNNNEKELMQSINKLRTQNQDLIKLNSRSQLELQSLYEQNEALRAENRALIEKSTRIRKETLQTHVKEQEKYLNTKTSIIKDRIQRELNEIRGEIGVRLTSMKNRNSPHEVALKQINSAIESIVYVVESINSQSIDADQVVTNYEQILGIINSSLQSQYTCDEIIQSQENKIKTGQLEIERLSIVIGEKEKSIYKEQQSHDQAAMELSRELKELADRYGIMLQENEHLMNAYDELLVDNQNLVEILAEANVPQNIILNGSERFRERELALEAKYQNEIENMQSHIDGLESQLREWKSEHESLCAAFDEVNLNKMQLESELSKLQLHVEKVTDLWEDEKLNNKKATELIKTLQEVKAKQERNINEFEAAQHQTTVLQDMLLAGPDTAESHVLQHLKEKQAQKERILNLEARLKESEDAFSTLESEFKKLLDKHDAVKAKYRTRESILNERITKLKQGYKETGGIIDETNECLASYQQQLQSIKPLIPTSVNIENDFEHPIPFATIIHQLYLHIQSLSDECYRINTELDDTRQLLNQKIDALEHQLEANHNHEKELVVSQAQFRDLETEKLELKKRIGELESRLQDNVQEHERTKNTLRMLIKTTTKYVTS